MLKNGMRTWLESATTPNPTLKTASQPNTQPIFGLASREHLKRVQRPFQFRLIAALFTECVGGLCADWNCCHAATFIVEREPWTKPKAQLATISESGRY